MHYKSQIHDDVPPTKKMHPKIRYSLIYQMFVAKFVRNMGMMPLYVGTATINLMVTPLITKPLLLYKFVMPLKIENGQLTLVPHPTGPPM